MDWMNKIISDVWVLKVSLGVESFEWFNLNIV